MAQNGFSRSMSQTSSFLKMSFSRIPIAGNVGAMFGRLPATS